MGTATYGGAGDLWGGSWTTADIKASNFGVVLVATNANTQNGRTRDATVDYIRVTITYTAPVITPTTTTVVSNSNPSTYGGSVQFTATVSPTPTNGVNVEFYDGATLLGTGTTSSGTATYTTAALTAATHSITAKFVGNGSFATSTSSVLSQVVNPKALTVTANDSSKTYGAANDFRWDGIHRSRIGQPGYDHQSFPSPARAQALRRQ